MQLEAQAHSALVLTCGSHKHRAPALQDLSRASEMSLMALHGKDAYLTRHAKLSPSYAICCVPHLRVRACKRHQ